MIRQIEISQGDFRTIVAALAEVWALNATRAAIPLDAFCHPIGTGGFNAQLARRNRQNFKRRAEMERDEHAKALLALGIGALPTVDVASFIRPADPKTASARHLGYPEFHAEHAREERNRLLADVLSLAMVPLCRDALPRTLQEARAANGGAQ